jgi:hypothetical protein
LVVSLLGYCGHTVLQAADGGEALTLVRSERPDLVITDLLMPVMDGYELVREIRSEESIAATPVMFYTANYRRDEVQPIATTLGVQQLLAKPIDPASFVQLVETSLQASTSAPPIVPDTFQREHGRAINAKLLDTVEELALAENALRDSEARFRSLTEFSPIGIFALTSALAVTYANPRMREICGVPSAADAPPLWRDLVHPDDRDRAVAGIFAAVQQRSHYSGQFRLVHRDHSQRLVQMQLAPVLDASSQASFVGTVEDISDVVEAQRERAQMERRLQVSERLESLGQLAAGIAHDFNNLLAIILNYTQFVQAGVMELTDAVSRSGAASVDPGVQTITPDNRWPQLQEDIGAIIGAAERATQLTRQLLMFARRDVAHPEVLDVNDVVRAVIAMLDRTIGEHVQFDHDLADELWPICIDRGRFEQVLVNLVVNARDAVGSGGVVEVTTENVELDAAAAARYSAPATGPYVRMTVSDDGEGMSAETKARAFEPFFSTKPTGSGTGLGLSTVYGIVTQLGGSVNIETEQGKGTRVDVIIPVHRGQAVEDRRGPGSAEFEVENPIPSRIVVAEDDADIRAIIGRVLTEHGHSVMLADGGVAALEILRDPATSVDLLLTDVVMPGMSGRELAEQVRVLRPGLAVLFMSGYADGLFAQATAESGVELLEKPFTPEFLIAAVARTSAR